MVRRLSRFRRFGAEVLAWTMMATSLSATAPRPRTSGPAPKAADWVPVSEYLGGAYEPFRHRLDSSRIRDKAETSIERAPNTFYGEAPPEQAGGAQQVTFPFFGPKRYTRTAGPPNVFNETIAVPAWLVGPYTLRVQNGEPDGTRRLAAASIEINGVIVADTADFNQNVTGFDRTVTLTPATTMRVRLASTPVGYLTLNLAGVNADTTPPQVAIVTPVPGSSSTNVSPRLTVSYRDPVGAGDPGASAADPATLRVTLDDVDRTSLFTKGADQASADLTAVQLTEGLHTLVMSIQDNAGNAASTSAQFRVDLTPPSIGPIAPSSGDYVGTRRPPITIRYQDGAELNLQTLQISINGVDRTALFTKDVTQATATLDEANQLPEGANTIVAHVRDTAGNEASATSAFIVDATNPVVTIAQPEPESFTGAETVDVTGTIADSSPATVTVDGVPAVVTGSMFKLAGVSLGTGRTATFTAVAVDAAGNTGQHAVTVTIDRVNPLVTIASPAAGAYLKSGSLVVEGTLTDESATEVSVNGVTATVTGNTFSATLETVDGRLDLHVVARDKANNIGEVTSYVVVDSVAPVLDLSAPADGLITNAASIAVSGSASDTSPFSLAVDGAPVNVTNGTFTGSVPLTTDGPRSIEVVATDAAGNRTARTLSVTSDKTLPSIQIVTPQGGAFLATAAPAVSIQWSDSLGLDLATMQVLVDGEDRTSLFTTSAAGATGSMTGLGDGVHTVVARITDRGGNRSEAETMFVVDTTGPSVAIEVPADNLFTAAATVDVRGTVSDASNVKVRVNGVEASVASGSFTASGIPVGNPPYTTITAVATDAAGNTREASVRLNVDRAPPAIHITSPAAGAYLQGPTISVSGTVTDGSPHSVEVNGQTAVVTNGTFTAQVPATDGPLTIQATATDAASNSSSAQVAVTIDTAIPNIAVSSPADGAVTNLANITIAGAVTDAAPVTVRVNNAPVELSGGAFSTMVALPGEGERAIVIIAVDAAGNTATRQLTVTRDATPPDLTIVTPAEQAILGARAVSVTGLVQDLTAVVVRVNGTDAPRAQNSWTGSAEFASEGTQTITVTAIDAAGNQSTVVRNVVLDLLAPVVTIDAPAPDALTGADAVTVTGRVSDVSLTGLTVAGTATPVKGGAFSAVVPLTEGENHIHVIATDGLARTGGAEVVVTRDSTPPLVEMSAPETISRRRGAQATITASDSFSFDRVVVVANGVTLGTFAQAQTVVDLAVPEALAAGSLLVVTATAIDRAGNSTAATRSLRVIADGVIVGQALADDTGLPLAGATVRMKDRTLSTDERGAYAIPAADVSVLVSIAKDGMTEVERLLPVESGVGTAVVDARLTPLGAAVTVDGTTTLGAPPAPRIANSVRVSVPGGAVPAGSTMRLTQLSPQGLPGLLPLGWSPLAAFDIRSNAAASGLTAEVRFTTLVPFAAGATGPLPETVHLVQYRSSLHAWVMVTAAVPVTNGEATVDLPMLIGGLDVANAFAFVVADAVEPPMPIAPIGEPLAGVAMTELPPDATSAGAVTPAIVPPGGGTALGLLAIQSPTPLPSGTIVQTQVTETFTLATGEVASEETRRQDIVLYRVPSIAPASVTTAPETFSAALSAYFPITPSRAFAPTQLVQGRVHLDVLAGREAVRGKSGGSEPLTLASDAVTFTVPGRALTEDTAIGIQTTVLSAFLPAAADLTPLVEVMVDLSGATLLIGAELSVAAPALGPLGPSDRFLIARVERLDGVPRLTIVAVADNLGDRLVSRSVFGLPGLIIGGRYVVYKTSVPFGFAATTVTAGGTTVASALVSSDRWPFFARTDAAGHATLAAPDGGAQLTARVPGTALEGNATVTLAADQMVAASIALNGTVTVATVAPADGAGAVPPSIQIEVTTTAPIAASSVTGAIVTLTTGGSEVAVRRVLAGSARTLALVPLQRLHPGAEYHLEVGGLVDIHGGPIAVPPVTFRTLTESVLVFNPEQLTVSFPDGNGVVTLTAPANSLPPGTSVLVVNAGSGEVATFTVGNDGSLSASLSATIDHRLIVTITTPTGETSTFERTKYVAADGTTAVGAAGGVIQGQGGIEVRIPEGATDRAVVMKIEPFDADFMPERPTMPGANFGSGIKIGSTSETHFKKEVDLAFPLPAGLPANPSDAYFYVYRRIEGPNGEILFETVDNAFVEGTGANARVVTASYPFTGYKDGWNQWQPVGPGMAAMGFGMVGNMATCHAIVMWTHNALLPGRPTLGVVVGKVLRPRFAEGSATPVFEGVPGVLVRRDDSPAGGGNNNIAITQANGQFVFYDPYFETGQQRIRAESAEGTFYATTFAVSELDSKIVSDDALTALIARGHFQNIAYANITLPPLTPAPPAPQVAIKVFTETGGVRKDTKGIVIEGTPLIIGFTAQNGTVSGATINGAELSVRVDPLQGQSAAGGMDAILDAPFVPAKAGSYTVTGTALAPFGPPASSSLTFRVIAAGGGTNTSVPGRPGVLTVVPKANANGVPVSTFVQLAFSEPVTHLNAENVTVIGPDGAVAVRMSGVAIAVDGSLVPVDTVTSTHSVTSLTLVPEQALRYNATYQVRLTEAIVDRDVTATGEPNPQPLVAFTSSFTTFGPEALGGSTDTPRGAGLVVLGDRAYFAETLYGGGTSAPNQTGYLRTYDLGNPLQPEPLDPPWFINYPPRDIAGEMDAEGRRTVVVATGPRTWFFLQGELVYHYDIQSSPSNLFVFDVTGDAPRWIGATNLTDNLMDGTPNRIVLKDGLVYAATNNKGIQVVDLEAAKAGFPETGAPENDFQRNGAIFKGGYNKAAVVNTIAVMEPADANPGDLNAYHLPLVDLKVGDYNVGGETKRLVVATGPRKQIGLVVVDPIYGGTIWRGPIVHASGSVEWGSAIATTTIDNRPIVLIGGLGVGTSSTGVLAVVDLSPLALNATAAPEVLKIIAIPHGVGDIVVSGTTAILAASGSAGSTGTGVATLVDLTKPGDPRIVGSLTGVGSRLALAGNLLYSTDRSFIKGLPTPLGGVQMAALSDVSLITAVKPEPILVSAGDEVFQDTDLTYRLVPPKVTDRAEVRIDVVGGGRAATIDAAGAQNTGTVTWPKGTIVNTNQRYQASLYAEADGHEITAIPRRLKFDKVPLAITTRDRLVRIQFALAQQGLFAERRYGVKVFLARQGTDFPAAPAFALTSDDIAAAYPNAEVWWDDLESGSAKTRASWVTRKIDRMDLPPGTDQTIRRQGFEIGAMLVGYPRIKVVITTEGEAARELAVASGVLTPDEGWSEIFNRVSQQIETGSSGESDGGMPSLLEAADDGFTSGPSDRPDTWSLQEEDPDRPSIFSALKYRALELMAFSAGMQRLQVAGFIDGFIDTWNEDKKFVAAVGAAAADPLATARAIGGTIKELWGAIPAILSGGLKVLMDAPNLLPVDQPFVLAAQGAYYSGYILGVVVEQALVTVIAAAAGAVIGNVVGAAVGAAATRVRSVQWVTQLSIRVVRVLRTIVYWSEVFGRAGLSTAAARNAFRALYRARAIVEEVWGKYPRAAALIKRAADVAKRSSTAAVEALRWLTIVDTMAEAAGLRFVAFFEARLSNATTWMVRWVESGRIPNGRRAVKDAFEASDRMGQASEGMHHLMVSTASLNIDGQANLAKQLGDKYAAQADQLDRIGARLANGPDDVRYPDRVVGETGRFLGDPKAPLFSEDGAEGLAAVIRAECAAGPGCDPRVVNKIRTTGTAEQLVKMEQAMARLKRLENVVSPETWQRVAKDMIDVEDLNLAAGTPPVTIHDFVELTLAGTDVEIGKVIRSLDSLRDAQGELHIGIVIKPGRGDGSTRWIVNAKSTAPGSRGFRFEVAGAHNLIQEGFVDNTRVVGMGFRILDGSGNLLVEGDLVEQFFTGGLRYIDFKAAGGNYSLTGLARAKQALLQGEIDEMVYAFEAGTTVPDAWLTAFNAANEELAEQGKRQMILRSAGAFQ